MKQTSTPGGATALQNLDRTWADAFARDRQAREEKQRAIDAMWQAGRAQQEKQQEAQK